MNILLFAGKKMVASRIDFWIMLGSIFLASSCFACGGFFDVRCNLNNGGLSPGNISKQVNKAGQDVGNTITKAGQDVGNAINELQANVLSGPTLEAAIIASRNTAINGSSSIPLNIRQQLTGYASEDSMNRVRYKIGDNGFVNLARLLEQGGFASAVTLIDVIVFRGPTEAADPSIWAHELTHVDQFADGAHSFAVRYARNWRSIEEPAYAKGDGFLNWWHQSQNNSSRTPASWPQQRQSGFPSGYGMKVCGCWGPNPPPFANEPLCVSGSVRVNVCPGFCAPMHPLYAYVCS